MAASVTAIRWYWHSGEEWRALDVQVNAHLERQYQEVQKLTNPTPEQLALRVDNERFIDLNFKTDTEIKRHFRGLDDEVGLVGLQRRYDDPMKRRAVKRDASLFSGYELVPTGPDADNRIGSLISLAVCAGATTSLPFAAKWTPRTVVIARGDCQGPRDPTVKAGAAIVSSSWLVECMTKGKIVSSEPFTLHVVHAPVSPDPTLASKRAVTALHDSATAAPTSPHFSKKARPDATEVAALPMQLAVGMQLAGLCLSTTDDDDDDEPSVHCSVVFTHVTCIEFASQSVSGIMTWASDGTITHRTLFTGSIDHSDVKRRVMRITEDKLLLGNGQRGVFEGRLNRSDCRLFSQDRKRQLALLPVPADRMAFVGSISSPVMLQITENTQPKFRALLVQLQDAISTEVMGVVTAEALTFEAPGVVGRLKAAGQQEGVYEGTLGKDGRTSTIRLQVAGS